MLLHRLAATVALPLALTACAGDPITPPPLSSATSTTSAPTPTEQPETAEEFIRRWRQTVDGAQTTGQTDDYRAMTPDCEACADFASRVESIYAHGGYIHTSGSSVVEVTERTANVFDVVVQSGETRFAESEGTPEQVLPGGSVTLRVTLKRTPTGWLVEDTTQLAA